MRRFVVIGQKATASPDFSLLDLAGTSGRLDVLLRSLAAALLVSHGLRRDVMVYLVLLGGPRAPRVLRVDGRAVRFIRPEERSLASLAKKALALPSGGAGFVPLRAGVAVADGDLDAVLADVAASSAFAPYVLEEGAPDIRDATLDVTGPVFFLGDHLGFDDATRTRLAAAGATPVGVGPISIHTDDVVTIVQNELDRREPARPPS